MSATDAEVIEWMESLPPGELGKWVHDALTQSSEFGPMYEELETVQDCDELTAWLSAEPAGLKVIYDYCRAAVEFFARKQEREP